LDERFRVLTAGDRSALPRHRTMRALIDWSYDLLSDDERALFRKLSIFAGGFTLETSAAICGDFEIDVIAVVDLLSSLVDKSLVQAEVVGDDTRYRLLESTRQYAREKLRNAGEEDAVAHEHARAFLGLSEQLDDAWETTPDRVWFLKAEPELENFRAALSWAFGARGDVLLGQRLASALRRVWSSFGAAEGQRWVQVAQQRVMVDTPDAVVAALDLAEAGLASLLATPKASLRAAERALARYRKLADPRGIADAERWIGWAQISLGEIADGEAITVQALEAARSLGARQGVIFALQSLGYARSFAGDLPGARQRFREALDTAWAIGAERSAAAISINLAETEFRGGDAAAALRLASEALTAFRTLGDARRATSAGLNMAAYQVALRQYDEARNVAREMLTATHDAQMSVLLVYALQHLAAIASLRPNADASVAEDLGRAARILGYVDACLNASEALRWYTEQQEYDAIIPALRSGLGEDQLSKLMAEGSTWSEDQAVAEAMLI
jgi:non-specific serine/threonine protein kinase